MDEKLSFIEQINYGEVVTIQDSKIVQVEKMEKKRFQQEGGEVHYELTVEIKKDGSKSGKNAGEKGNPEKAQAFFTDSDLT